MHSCRVSITQQHYNTTTHRYKALSSSSSSSSSSVYYIHKRDVNGGLLGAPSTRTHLRACSHCRARARTHAHTHTHTHTHTHVKHTLKCCLSHELLPGDKERIFCQHQPPLLPTQVLHARTLAHVSFVRTHTLTRAHTVTHTHTHDEPCTHIRTT